MKNALLVTFGLALLIFSCRKKEEPPEPNPKGFVAGNGYYGWCRAYNQYDYLLNYPQSSTNPTYSLSFARAFFTWNELNTVSTVFDLIKGGTVVVNSRDTLELYENVYFKNIVDTFYVPSVKWDVSGHNSPQNYINGFNYNYNLAFPSFTGFSLLNDTVVKVTGCNLILTGFANADRCIFYIQDDFVNESQKINVSIINDTVKVNFTPAEISNVSTGPGYYHLYVYNDTIKNIGDRNIRFSNVTYYRFVNLNIVN